MAQQYANPALTPAKLLAVNVNGLAGEAKRKAFLQFVMDAAWDVLVLSETHCGDLAVACKWLKEGAGPGKPWLGAHFWALGTSASRGVAVLLRHSFAPKAKIEFQDNENGRLLRVGWERGPGLRPAAVLAVYAPSDGAASRSTFFADGGPLHQALLAGTGTSADLFVGGDFIFFFLSD
jgi:exonuclease III